MTSVEDRLTPFIVAVSDLLLVRSTAFPYRQLFEVFADAIDAEPSWNWSDPEQGIAFETMKARPGWPPEDRLEEWREIGAPTQPLMHWYIKTGSLLPQTLERVPVTMVPRHAHAIARSFLRTADMDQQLSIPVQLDQNGMCAFVLNRSGPDLGDVDIELATRVQPLLMVLHRQVSILAGSAVTSPTKWAESGLTEREMAVTMLLGQGLTSAAIARRLGSSPRTVQKHLERIYRKLDVHDRLMAVRVAEEARLIPAPRRNAR